VPEAEVTTAKAGYLSAIFLGPVGSVIPLILYVIKRRKSPFLRYHTATAANLSLTCLLYGAVSPRRTRTNRSTYRSGSAPPCWPSRPAGLGQRAGDRVG
jgi:hypothetical protein